MDIETIEAIRTLLDFADDHAHDTYDPDEYPEFRDSYDSVNEAVEKVKEYLDND